MSLRHSAGIVMVGWYLITPPIESCIGAFTGRSCEPAPLSKWQIRVTLDSSAECERLKAVWIEKGRMYLGESDARSRTAGSRVSQDEAEYMTYAESASSRATIRGSGGSRTVGCGRGEDAWDLTPNPFP